MNAIAQALVDGLLVLEDEVGATIVFPITNGATYPCVGGAELGGKLLGQGGFRTTAQVQIVLRAGALNGAAAPAEKQKLQFSSAAGVALRTLRIDTVTRLHGEIFLLECNDANQAG